MSPIFSTFSCDGKYKVAIICYIEFCYHTNTYKKPKEFVKDIQIDTDFEILFPDDYINVISERLSLYSELSSITSTEKLQLFETKLVDRFGELQIQVVDLLDSVRLKWAAKHIGLERLILKRGNMIGYFISNQDSSYYESPIFTQVLQFVQSQPLKCTMKEKQTKNGLRLLLSFNEITSVQKALFILKEIH